MGAAAGASCPLPAGTVAIDYAVNHGEDLERLVLIDAQVGVCGGG